MNMLRRRRSGRAGQPTAESPGSARLGSLCTGTSSVGFSVGAGAGSKGQEVNFRRK
jgi:hypothetical protein